MPFRQRRRDRGRGGAITNRWPRSHDREGEAQQRFPVRDYNRCRLRPAARVHAPLRLCRICFRERALLGELPGVTKSSW
jgi:small subunit ribosomal protein S14